MSKEQFLKENLRPGEVYAGLLVGENGAPDHHIFVLPGEAEGVNWEAAKAWAEQAGGELPTRREQRVLFANAKAAFKAAWYWSSEQHAGNAAYAWSQSSSATATRTTIASRTQAARGRSADW